VLSDQDSLTIEHIKNCEKKSRGEVTSVKSRVGRNLDDSGWTSKADFRRGND
jgi:hypothetical protein